MKHAVGFFLPLCIFSFLAFGISVWVLGVEDVPTSSAELSLASTTTRLDEDYSRIEVTSNFGDVHIFPNDDDSTVIIVDEVLVDDVTASVDNNTLHIYCGNINSKEFSFSDLFDGMFTFNSGNVTIYVPEKTYDALYATNNAGSTEILNISAKVADLDTNAGDLTYAQPSDFRCEKLSVKTNAGTSRVFNANTYSYDVDLNAGDIYMYNLTGAGTIEVDAGDCHLNYAELNGNIKADVSAGSLDINLPADISAEIIADISAGDVEIDYYNTECDMDDSDTLTIGSGKYQIIAKISAGDIDITDDVEYMLPDLPTLPPITDTAAAIEAPVTSTVVATMLPTESDVVDIDLGALGGVNVGEDHVDVNVGPVNVNVDEDKVKVDIGALKVDIG